MLDLPMTLFLLLHLFFYKKDKYVLSGLCLGLASGCKAPFFIPMLFIIASLKSFRSKKYINIVKLGVTTVLGYILSYFPTYFIYHPNPIPWLRLHDKVIAFHTSGGSVQNPASILITIFTGKYYGFWEGAEVYPVLGWSAVFIIALFSILKTRKINHLSLLILCYIALNMLINFWPRYLMPIVPICLLLIHKSFLQKKYLYLILFFSYIPQLYAQFNPSPPNIAGMYYKESYQLLTSDSQSKISLESWKNSPNLLLKPKKIHNQWKFELLGN